MSDEIEVIMPAKVADNRPYPKEEGCDSVYNCTNPDHPKDERGNCTLEADNGTMPENVEELEKHIVGRRIVKCEIRPNTLNRGYGEGTEYLAITLDNGMEVQLLDSYDCCASTSLINFLLNPGLVDHFISGVGTTDGFHTWHIYCDYGDILKLDVEWDSGNPFYYAYGFAINVVVNADTMKELPAGKKAIEG